MIIVSYAIGVDLGGTKIRAGLIDSEGNFLKRRKTSTNTSAKDRPVLQIINLVKETVREANILNNQIAGFGVSIPGVVNMEGEVWAPNIPGWNNYPLKKKLQREFKFPILVESDRNAAILGEQWLGAAQGAKDAVFLIVGTGIGAGILINGELCRGHDAVAGAVGWLVVDREKRKKYQKIGCLEARAAGPAIKRRAIQRIKEGVKTGILSLAKDDLRGITTELVAQAALDGDKEAKSILEKAGEEIGIGIANIVNVLNPELVVIGGGVANVWPAIKNEVLKTAKTWAHPLAFKSLQIVPSQLKDNVCVLGVARLIYSNISNF